MKGDREKCIQAGADDYLTKPLHTPDLLAALDRLSSTKNTALPSASQQHADHASLPVLDLAGALQRMDGDRDLLEEVLQLFAEEWPKNKKEIQEALEAADCKTSRCLAHSLKGASANVGASRLSRAALELEKLAAAETLDAARQQWEVVKNETETLLNELDSLLRRVAR